MCTQAALPTSASVDRHFFSLGIRGLGRAHASRGYRCRTTRAKAHSLRAHERLTSDENHEEAEEASDHYLTQTLETTRCSSMSIARATKKCLSLNFEAVRAPCYA